MELFVARPPWPTSYHSLRGIGLNLGGAVVVDSSLLPVLGDRRVSRSLSETKQGKFMRDGGECPTAVEQPPGLLRPILCFVSGFLGRKTEEPGEDQQSTREPEGCRQGVTTMMRSRRCQTDKRGQEEEEEAEEKEEEEEEEEEEREESKQKAQTSKMKDK